jgi:spore coat polysaccharide biosynthesis predicted glycosyltransferase SpsG
VKLQIVCRGSLKDGLGHLLRTRTFARHASGSHEIEVVAIIEPDLEPVLSDLPCSVRFVRGDDATVPCVTAFAPDALVFDTVRIEPAVFQRLADQALLNVSISPVFDHARRLDVLFTRSSRTETLPGVRIFGGLKYAIFNERCLTIDDATFARNLALNELPIAICMGGADAANKTLAVLGTLKTLEDASTIWVLLGEGYAHCYNQLVDTVRGNSRHEIILAKTNRSMWRVMSNCALAILAGGITSVEAVYAGLPTINLFEREEHQQVMTELFELGVALNGGLLSEHSLGTARDMLRRLNRNRDELQTMRERSRGLADALGSQRVLREIEQQLLAKALRGARSAPSRATDLALNTEPLVLS